MASAVAAPENKPATSAVPAKLYLLLTSIVVAAFWFPRMSRGFWTDEVGTYWIAKDGIGSVWQKLQTYPGQSLIYTHLSALFLIDGPGKELWLRVPSVIATLFAAYVLYKLTERIAGPGSGFLAVVPFCCFGTIVDTATNARPYALALPVILISFWSLREWVHTRGRAAYVAYCLSTPFIIYFHYFFGLIYLVQFVYLIAASTMGRTVSWRAVAGAASLVAVSALPLLRQLLTAAGKSSSFKTDLMPSLTVLLNFYPLNALMVTMLGLALFRFLHPKLFHRFEWISKDDLVLLLSWLLLGPLALFACVHITRFGVFAPRYALYALLPFFILLAWAISQVGNERARFAIVAGIALNGAMYLHQLNRTEWRGPLATAGQMAGPDTPLLLRSGFVESADVDLTGEPKSSSYLFAPLTVYPVSNEIIPVPFYVDRAAQNIIQSAVTVREGSHRRFCLVADEKSDVLDTLPAWFAGRGYTASTTEQSGFKIILFERRNAT